MASLEHRDRWFWESFHPRSADAGATLAALRRGVNRIPGDVPEIWPHHRVVLPEHTWTHDAPPPALAAEHAALVTFAIHQQSQPMSMHRPGVPLGRALLALRKDGKYSEAAVDRRVNAMATATDVKELTEHLRRLVSQLRGIRRPLDYTGLVQDLFDWHYPQRRSYVRRAWGSQYYLWSSADTTTEATTEAPE
ncbi:type I-E CRISPR-associated protein Cse2/CasB [Catenulispora rubra]|uniref:type I-E CRISPR-associated protein Cse2/CasB n=1 Tax=Catenulispora rubra TaxID=280293 RepID=UPI0018926469|nr:type I-E CRISPR-associated protein Cse2/CasB [Catenulispora rubra]